MLRKISLNLELLAIIVLVVIRISFEKALADDLNIYVSYAIATFVVMVVYNLKYIYGYKRKDHHKLICS